MSYCIPKHIAKTLKEAAKRGEINMKDLYSMNSQERRSFFGEYAGETNAKGINAGFETAMSSQQKSALKTWAKNTFDVKKKGQRKDIIDNIDELVKEGVLDPNSMDSFLQDMVAEKLGITISAEEAKTISKKSVELGKSFQKKEGDFDLPATEYFENRRDMDKYMKSLLPSSPLKVFTGTIGKGAMLLNLKSAVTNITGNTVQGIEQSFERRIASNQYSSVVDKGLMKQYKKQAQDIYKKSGYDITRMNSYSDGIKVLGERVIHSEGKGIVRKAGRIYEDIVFDKLLGAPDIAFAQFHYLDSSALAATKIAKEEGLKGDAQAERANELFKEAASITPTSLAGEFVREQAIADALVATFQDDNVYSSMALGIRDLFNKATGDFRLGDQIMPFVKTPANVVGMTLDAGGLGAVKGLYQLPRAVNAMKAGNPAPMRDVTRNFTRTGLGMTASFLLSTLIPPDDFMGQYPTTDKERELMRLGNVRPNSIKIGDKWISLDYFGFLGGPLVGFLYSKKYGKDLPSHMYSYASGVATQAAEIPGFDALKDVTKSISDLRPEEDETVGEIGTDAVNAVTDFVRARVVPGIVYDTAKAFDTSEREVDYDDPLSKFKSTIPGIRNTLPEKTDVFGDVIKGEPAYSSILFGARVKTARDNELISELNRLDDTGNLPSISRPEKSSSRFKSLKTQLDSDEFKGALEYFRKEYKSEASKLTKSSEYGRMSDEDKKDKWNSIKTKQMNRTLEKYGYKK